MTETNKIKKKGKIKEVNTYVLLFLILIFITILSYIIPSGQYDFIEDSRTGRELVDPDSFHYVEKNPASIFDMFRAIPKGMIDGAKIIFFIFIISGAIQIVSATGAINTGILKLTKRFEGREKYLIPILMIVFSLTGAFLGFSEENLVFVPLTVSLAKYLGYDPIVGICISYLATQVGFLSAMMNPFSVGVAHGIADLPLFSGIGFRFIVWVIYLGVTCWYVMSYGEKVRKDPKLSIVADIEDKDEKGIDFTDVDAELKASHKFIYIVFIIAIITIIYGTYKLDWGIVDIAAVFLIIGLVSGLVGKFSLNKIADEFVQGARGIVFGALIVGFAKAIYVVMAETMILDTIVHSLVSSIKSFPQSISVIGLYIIQWTLNILIPSATGQAAVSMPIMIPIADMLKINRQVSVLAFQLGDGINNSIIPTSSTLLAACTIANVPYDRWFKFLWRLTLIWTGIGVILLLIANAIGFGPF